MRRDDVMSLGGRTRDRRRGRCTVVARTRELHKKFPLEITDRLLSD